MLDLARMKRIDPSPKPRMQRLVANFLMAPNYRFLPGIDLKVEGWENLPKDETVIFAMNHTDRYSAWPFQYILHRKFERYTTTWVKGKYYENAFEGWFMEATNTIPAVSLGYILLKDFKTTMGRTPSDEEYRLIRDTLEGKRDEALRGVVPEALLDTPRSILGYLFGPHKERYVDAVRAIHAQMVELFWRANERAMKERGLDVFVFPQGTRSKRLSEGRIGIAELAVRTGARVVPVGCSGGDVIYPGKFPFASSGQVIYRLGRPIELPQSLRLTPVRDKRVTPPVAEMQKFVDGIMEEINTLVDPDYQFSDTKISDGVKGGERFL